MRTNYCFPMDDRPGCMIGRAGLLPGCRTQTRTRIRLLLFSYGEWNSMTTELPCQMDHRRGLGWDWDDLWMIEHNRRTSNSSWMFFGFGSPGMPVMTRNGPQTLGGAAQADGWGPDFYWGSTGEQTETRIRKPLVSYVDDWHGPEFDDNCLDWATGFQWWLNCYAWSALAAGQIGG